jgi:hypothetical protein
MKFLFPLPLLLFILISCNSKHNAKKPAFDPKKFMDSMPEPLLKQIPDSMKKWLPVLETVRRNDQKFRSIEDPSLLEDNKEEQRILDRENLRIVDSFFNIYGYPSPKLIGIKAMIGLNMVIQHAPLEIQEKYFGYVCTAYVKGDVPGETLALLEDRINARNHRKQFYGTQFFMYKGKQIPFPVVNVDSLYVYRKNMKMPWTMDYYLKMFKSKWDSVEYKKSFLK